MYYSDKYKAKIVKIYEDQTDYVLNKQKWK